MARLRCPKCANEWVALSIEFFQRERHYRCVCLNCKNRGKLKPTEQTAHEGWLKEE